MTKVFARDTTTGERKEVDLTATAYARTVTTDNTTGQATITFPTGLFSAAPIVSATPVAAVSGQSTNVEIVSVTATTCILRTWATRNLTVVLINIGSSPVVLVGTTVHVTACASV